MSKEQKVLVLYWSKTGNTQKVAQAIERGAVAAGAATTIAPIQEAADVDMFDYDVVFFGAPSYSYAPPDPVLRFLKDRSEFHRKRGDIKAKAPKLPGKRAVVFVTYSGPHTGVDEAIPVGKYMGQFFAHIGYDVVGEWYVVGEHHANPANSVEGLLGDVRGRPTADDLRAVEQQTKAMIE